MRSVRCFAWRRGVLASVVAVIVACGGGSGDGDDDGPSVDAPLAIDAMPTDATPTATLTVTRGGNGSGTVTSPAGIDCGSTCTITVAQGTSVTLTAVADASSSFMGWTGGGCSGTGPCVVDVTGDRAIQALFALDHSLVVTLAGGGGGVVTSTPAGIDCGVDCSEAYPAGTMVTLVATPNGQSAFTSWSGACTGTAPCTVTLDAARMVTATFALVTHTLTVAKTGSGAGTVTSTPAGIDCGADCSEVVVDDTVVMLTANPANGSVFTGWTGGGCTGTSPCMVTVTASQTITADFGLTQHTLDVVFAGNGSGGVGSSPAGITCPGDCGESFSFGTMVTLTASANTGSTFTGWSGGGCSGMLPCTTTVTAAATVTATFTLNRYTLDVTRTGTGSGTVTSVPGTIDCGGTCMNDFDHGTSVTLSAVAASGSEFLGWTGGGCTGTADCTVVMTADTSISASFRRLPVWDGTWTGTTSQGRPITLTVVNNRVTTVQIGWAVAGCGVSGTTTTNFGGGGRIINVNTGAFSGTASGTPFSYTISGTFALDESGVSGSANFTWSQPFPPVCTSSSSATWTATRS